MSGVRLSMIGIALLAIIPRSTRVTYAEYVFWTESGTESSIRRANLDGTNEMILIADPNVMAMTYIALDQRSRKIYWNDDTQAGRTDRIRRMNYDGSGVEDVLVLPSGQPAGLQIDSIAGKMIWAERFTNRIQRAELDGSNIETLVSNAPEPRGLELDLVNGHIYWVEIGNRIRRANLDGSNAGDVLSIGLNRPFDISLDISNGLMYWAQLGESDSGDGSIWRANFDGSNAELLLSDLKQSGSLEYNSADRFLYWTQSFSNEGINRLDTVTLVNEVLADGGTPQHITVSVPEPGISGLSLGVVIVVVASSRRRLKQPESFLSTNHALDRSA